MKITKFNELAEEIKKITGAELVRVHHAMDFCSGLSVNKKGGVRMSLSLNANDTLVNKEDIRKWKGQLLLLWIEFPNKKEFKYF